MEDDCESCNLDRVEWRDVVPCVYKSWLGIWRDFVIYQKTDIIGVFSRDDRILYVIGTVLAIMTIQLVMGAVTFKFNI